MAAASRIRRLERPESGGPDPNVKAVSFRLIDRTSWRKACDVCLATHRKEQSMLDVILLAVGLGFFALSIVYVYACDRL
jgi:hypothetical protein